MSLTLFVAPVLALGWLCLAGQVAAVLRFARRPLPAAVPEETVSILKPLHGAEPGLYENLRSFVQQDYAAHQIVLGVNDPEDGALPAVHALIRAFPEADISLVVDRRCAGSNQKVANLENLLPEAHHDLLILADSDMRVDRSYLAAVTAPLSDPGVGIVTCLYKGVSSAGLWSALGALQINFGFLPNALLADALGMGHGCFGATIALSRATLGRIGGLAPLRDELADDHLLGEAALARGLAVELSPCLVEARVFEPSLLALWRHELRWARTMRGIAPVGFAGSVVTHPVALALLFAIAAGFSLTACILLGITSLVRWAAAGVIARRLGLDYRQLWLLPLRDVLSFGIFVASFFGRRVFWRDRDLRVDPGGRMTLVDGEKVR